MEIELTTSSARRLEDFLTGKLPSIKLLAAYFLRQCADAQLSTQHLYALDPEGGLVAVDVEDLLNGVNAQDLNQKLQDTYYELIEALDEFPDLLNEQYHVLMYGPHPEAGKRPITYYSMVDLLFQRVGKTPKSPVHRQLSFAFEPADKPKYKMAYKKKRMKQAMLKRRYLDEELHDEFGFVVSELKHLGLRLQIPENIVGIKAYHRKTGQEVAMLYPAGNCFGFDMAGSCSYKSQPSLFNSYGSWLANSLRYIEQYLAQHELFEVAEMRS